MMKVLFASAEAVPFAKVGGLADVVGTLPIALRKLKIDARVILPGYGFIEHFANRISYLFSFAFTHRNGTSEIHVYTCVRDGVPFYFVQGWPFFGQEYSVYTDWNWDVPRFIFFNQVVMATAWQLSEKLGWFPDVVHANDWHTGLLPFLISENRWRPEWSRLATIMSIHNIAYQGETIGGYLWEAGIPERHHPDLQYNNLSDNMLAIGIAYADLINTVSPRYAIEIQYPSAGYELTVLIRSRSQDLRGILNGIDVERWNPETDERIVSHYNADNFETNRLANKRHLQYYTRLPVQENTPVIGMVSRLTWQKGIDLAVPALWQLLAETEAQLVVLGIGEPDPERQLAQLQLAFPDKARVYLYHDPVLAQQIYAGCDLFLMPSHFEPCGIGQMMAMRYGALPVVRETGGLADTVINYDNADAAIGTGFVFLWEDPVALLNTLRWAIATYREKPEAWKRMQKRAMQSDFSWGQSAKQYAEIYQKAINKYIGEPVS